MAKCCHCGEVVNSGLVVDDECLKKLYKDHWILTIEKVRLQADCDSLKERIKELEGQRRELKFDHWQNTLLKNFLRRK